MTSDPFSGVVPDRRGSDRVYPEDIGDERWWWADFDEKEGGTFMDLRRWLQARHEEGFVVMSLEPIPARWQVVVNGSHARHRERPLWSSEREWLLRAWPAQLQGAELLAPG